MSLDEPTLSRRGLGRLGVAAATLAAVGAVKAATTPAAAQATGGCFVVAEDHHPEGGLGEAVTSALVAAGQENLTIAHLAVREMPGSGTGAELLAWAGIDAEHIAAAARELAGGR
jgi:transketolase